MPNIETFNTGRGYSEHGQRIACAELADGRVMFADVDRHIDGITTIPRHYGDSLQTHVMWCYDRSHYNSGAWDHKADAPTRVGHAALMDQLIAAAREYKHG